MELLAKEKAEQLISQENVSRRKLRQLQVREQSNEWMDRNRQKYMFEKDRQIQLITESLIQDAQQKAVRDIEIMEKMHDLCAAQVGAAHRAAADLPDFEFLRSQKERENLEKAKSRGAEALAQERAAAEKAFQMAQKLKSLRENIRKEEDERLKEYAARSRYVTRSQHAVDKIVDKLMNKRSQKSGAAYQPSLARTLRVPKESASDARISKSDRKAGLSRKPKDVTYYDVTVPQGTLKYPAPAGLVQKHPKSAVNAFDAAKNLAAEHKERESRQTKEDMSKKRLAEVRGKKALKVAKLQRQLDDIQNEFLESGFHVDPKLNDSFLGLSEDSSGEEEYDGQVLAVSHEGVQTSPDFGRAVTPPAGVPSKKQKPASGPPQKVMKDQAISARRTPPSGTKSAAKQAVETPKSPTPQTKVPKDSSRPVVTPPRSPASRPKTPRSGQSKQTTPRDDAEGAQTTGVRPKTPEALAGQPPGSPLAERRSVKANGKEAKSPSSARRMDTARTEGTASPTAEEVSKTRVDQSRESRIDAVNGIDDGKTKRGKPRPKSPISRLFEAMSRPDVVDIRSSRDEELQENGRPTSSLSKYGEIPDHVDESEKPRLISTKKSIRFSQDQEAAADRKQTVSPFQDNVNGVTTSGRSTPTSKSTRKEKESVKVTPKSAETSGKTKTSKDSSSSLVTLSSIGSKEDISEKHLTDHRSPPDTSKTFPVTSTPAKDDEIDLGMESPLTNAGRGVPFTPRTAVKRKKALQYYIKKLLELRPESMARLEATSSVNFKSSYVEIPTSAVSSIVGSSPASESSSLSEVEIINETGNTNNTRRNSKSQMGTMNGTSDYYTTLSSVTEEEEEEEDQSESYGSTTQSSGANGSVNQASSGETIARVTVSVSPKSSN